VLLRRWNNPTEGLLPPVPDDVFVALAVLAVLVNAAPLKGYALRKKTLEN
jgi:hypothetical protein